jgi:hypothetical protein|tara:strand:+ start:502 stop:813 length:312 start_codon:yes stop_codon:yes gene_type:complete
MSEEKSTHSYKNLGDRSYLNKLKKLSKLRKNDGSSPMDYQVGGNHYKDCGIQPVDYIFQNNLDYFEGNVVKYITRHRKKAEGRKDVEKAIHYAQMILELYYNK